MARRRTSIISMENATILLSSRVQGFISVKNIEKIIFQLHEGIHTKMGLHLDFI
jgi:hypothetical protein